MSSYILLSKNDYFEDLISEVQKLKKGDSLYLMTMAIDSSSNLVSKLFSEIEKSLDRGSHISILIDAYEYIISNQKRGLGPLFYSNKLNGRLSGHFYTVLNNRIESLKQAGAKVEIINKPRHVISSPIRHRSHIKLAVLDSLTYVGGVNLVDDGHEDYMVKINNKDLSLDLQSVLDKVNITKNVRQALNSNFRLNNKSDQIVIDQGRSNDSVILDQAIDIINRAQKDIIFTCQFFPDRVILLPLKNAARRGVKTKIIFNHHSKHFFPLSFVQFLMLLTTKLFLPKNLELIRRSRSEKFLHAKILLTEQSIIIGSHNMVGAGVKYGTAEIALISTDKNLIKKVRLIYL